MAKKYYAIQKENGIITNTWDMCKEITSGNHYNFKGFKTLQEAIDFIGADPNTITYYGFSPSTNTYLKKERPSFEENDNLAIYTDGGCIPNPGGKGGIGVIILRDNAVLLEISEGYYPTTNNRMEMMAVIRALEEIGEGQRVTITSDSQYVVRTMNGEWSANTNTDLWIRLKKLCEKQKAVYFSWVRGHNNNRYNERCDELATKAINTDTYTTDAGYIGKATTQKKKETVKIEECSKKREIPDEGLTIEGAKCIRKFLTIKKPTFKDFADVRTGGRDHFSSMKFEKLTEMIQDVYVTQILSDSFFEEKDTEKAMRWFLRGLPLNDAIQKVNVDNEISKNTIQARYRK